MLVAIQMAGCVEAIHPRLFYIRFHYLPDLSFSDEFCNLFNIRCQVSILRPRTNSEMNLCYTHNIDKAVFTIHNKIVTMKI